MFVETYTKNTIKTCPYTNLIFDSNNTLHNHTFFEISFVIKGECINTLKGKSKVMSVGDAIILRPSDTHSIKIKTKGNYYHRDIYCMPEKMKEICDVFSTTLFDEICSAEDNYFNISGTLLKALEQGLNTFNGRGAEHSKNLDMLATSILATLLGSYVENRISNKQNYPQWLNKLIDSLNSVDNMALEVEEIIKDTNYSHGYLCREFKHYIGKTIVQYLTEIRIHYSTNLLRNSNLAIIEIANMVGYSNPNNYIRNFKDIYMLTPSQWRKKYVMR